MSERSQTVMTDHVLVPIAGEEDGRRTALALEPYAPAEITLLFVVEKAGGTPDAISVEQAEGLARESFDAFRAVISDVDEEIAYGTDVTETIFEAADEVGANAVAFTTRGGGGLVRLLTGDMARQLVTENEIPVISLPRSGDA